AASLRRTPMGALVLVQPKTPTSRRTLEIPPPVVHALKAQRIQQKADHAAASLLSAAGVTARGHL
ncbi:MAG: hypothetical protein M0R80_31925, partial [Proteobacteria bacterium]|nr:hypothetical protein [Pseudomonadota bacterium]